MSGYSSGGATQTVPGVLLDSVELSGTQTTITFSSISQIYRRLILIAWARTDDATVTIVGTNYQFNNDTTAANYHAQLIIGDDNASAAGEFATFTGGIAAAAGTTANSFAYNKSVIENYASASDFKICQTSVQLYRTTGDVYVGFKGLSWINATPAAITEIDITSGSGGDFVSGSKFYLYGQD